MVSHSCVAISSRRIRFRVQCLCFAIVERIKQHNTHILRRITVHYAWHPLHGETLRIWRRRRGEGKVVEGERSTGEVREIPEWMTDAERCASMDQGPPVVRLSALWELFSFLNTLTENCVSGRGSSAARKETDVERRENTSSARRADTSVRTRSAQGGVGQKTGARADGSDSRIARRRGSKRRRKGQK